MTAHAPPAARPEHTFDAATLRAMALYPLNPGHGDLDNEQPFSVRVGDAWVRCTLGDVRQAQREAGPLASAARQAARINQTLTLALDFKDARPRLLCEAQRQAGELGSALLRLTLEASVKAAP